MAKLAINGGKKVRNSLFPAYRVIGEEEKKAVEAVLDSGILSKYLGCWAEDFYGGPQVRALESEWAEYYGVKHAIAVNSATSGIYCAVGAAGISNGDKVIVSPYTMCASATAPIIYNAIPVFADIEYDFYCIDPDDFEKKIDKDTKAIIVVDILGQPYNAERINEIAKKHNLIVIEDNAQGPYAQYGKKYAGTLGDIGVFSLNYHKHIHCGEGGIVVTDNDELAERVRLIRNHAEAVVKDHGVTNLNNMFGFNLRMTEVEAAIAREQLKKLRWLVEERRKNVAYIERGLSDISFLNMPKVRDNCTHSYYIHAIKYDETATGVTRERFVEAMQAELMPIELREAEGVKITKGYLTPLYRQPMFTHKSAYGNNSFPFADDISYEKGICPVCEKVCEKETVFHELMRPYMTQNDLDDVLEAFHKVAENMDELR